MDKLGLGRVYQVIVFLFVFDGGDNQGPIGGGTDYKSPR